MVQGLYRLKFPVSLVINIEFLEMLSRIVYFFAFNMSYSNAFRMPKVFKSPSGFVNFGLFLVVGASIVTSFMSYSCPTRQFHISLYSAETLL